MTQELPPELEEKLGNETQEQIILAEQLPEDIKTDSLIEDGQKINELREAILRAQDTDMIETSVGMLNKEGVLFVAHSEPAPKTTLPTWMKKAATFLGIASVGVLSSQQGHAEGGDKTTSKPGDKKEITAPAPASSETIRHITVEDETIWNNFLLFLKGKGLTQDPRLKHVEFSRALIDEFNKNNKDHPFDPNSIKSYQHGINLIRKEEIKQVKAGKAIVVDEHGKEVPADSLMKDISPEDGKFGPQSASYWYPGYKNTIHYEDAVKLHLANNKDAKLIINKKDEVHEGLIKVPTESK
jgi:hypothetical protein